MRTTIIFLALFVAVCISAPQGPRQIIILVYRNDVRPDGYSFAYETSDGITREEEGYFRNPGTADEVWEVKGKSAWVDPEGNQQSQEFVANENGYQLLGAPSLGVRGGLTG